MIYKNLTQEQANEIPKPNTIKAADTDGLFDVLTHKHHDSLVAESISKPVVEADKPRKVREF